MVVVDCGVGKSYESDVLSLGRDSSRQELPRHLHTALSELQGCEASRVTAHRQDVLCAGFSILSLRRASPASPFEQLEWSLNTCLHIHPGRDPAQIRKPTLLCNYQYHKGTMKLNSVLLVSICIAGHAGYAR